MKNAQTIYNEQKLSVKDSLLNDFEDKLIHYGWLCQVEIINEMVVNEQEKLDLLRKIRIKDVETT